MLHNIDTKLGVNFNTNGVKFSSVGVGYNTNGVQCNINGVKFNTNFGIYIVQQFNTPVFAVYNLQIYMQFEKIWIKMAE